MRTLLLAVVVLGCGGAEPVSSTSQAVLPPGGPVKGVGVECFCSTNGTSTGTILCVGSTWQCAPNDGVAVGWEAQCDGSSTGSAFFDWDQTGNACSGNAYSGFPDECPELTNIKRDGKYFCVDI